MKNDSYAELTKAYAMANQQKKEKLIQHIYIDVLIYEALLKDQQEKVKRKIDTALDTRDQKSFSELVQELNMIEKQLNA